MQGTLNTPRLTLRPVRSGDVDLLWALWTEPDVRRFLWDDRSITREEAAATVADCLALGSSGLGLWILERTSEDSPNADIVSEGGPDTLGCAGLLPVSIAAEFAPQLSGLIEPVVALAPAVCGRGYAQEALAALLTYAAGTLGLTRLAGVTDVPNLASDRMLRRAGFRVTGEAAGQRHPLRTYVWDAVTDTPRVGDPYAPS